MQSRPDHEALAANPECVTSVAIAAEAIGDRCGLGNYLACLRPALDAQRGDSRQLRVFGMAGNSAVIADCSAICGPSSGPVASDAYCARSNRRVVTSSSHTQGASWAAVWRALDARTVCLLPHVVCTDNGALDEYYSALSARRLVWVVHDLHPLHFPDQWNLRICGCLPAPLRLLAGCARAIIVHTPTQRPTSVGGWAPIPPKSPLPAFRASFRTVRPRHFLRGQDAARAWDSSALRTVGQQQHVRPQEPRPIAEGVADAARPR